MKVLESSVTVSDQIASSEPDSEHSGSAISAQSGEPSSLAINSELVNNVQVLDHLNTNNESTVFSQ